MNLCAQNWHKSSNITFLKEKYLCLVLLETCSIVLQINAIRLWQKQKVLSFPDTGLDFKCPTMLWVVLPQLHAVLHLVQWQSTGVEDSGPLGLQHSVQDIVQVEPQGTGLGSPLQCTEGQCRPQQTGYRMAAGLQRLLLAAIMNRNEIGNQTLQFQRRCSGDKNSITPLLTKTVIKA